MTPMETLFACSLFVSSEEINIDQEMFHLFLSWLFVRVSVLYIRFSLRCLFPFSTMKVANINPTVCDEHLVSFMYSPVTFSLSFWSLALQLLRFRPFPKLSPLLLPGQSPSFTQQWTKRKCTTTFLCSWHCEQFLITVRAMYSPVMAAASTQEDCSEFYYLPRQGVSRV